MIRNSIVAASEESDDELPAQDDAVSMKSFLSFVSSSSHVVHEDGICNSSLCDPTGSTAENDDSSLASTSSGTASASDDCSSHADDETNATYESDLIADCHSEQLPLSTPPAYTKRENKNYLLRQESYNRIPHSNRNITQRRQQLQQSTPLQVETGSNIGTIANASSTSSEPVVVLGMDISNLSATSQFLVCAGGVFAFNLSFGFLQEFVSVEICNRNLGLFLSMVQFAGYTCLSYILRTYVNQNKDMAASKAPGQIHSYLAVPTYMYLGLGGLSAIDMAMTNMAMHYINFPAKTLMKSSRVVFTMIFGVLLAGKRYRLVDYLVVLFMVAGLAIFMQADASSSAIFEPMGVFMLTISLICDGATNIISETIMKNYGVGQDELIFRMYSLALIVVTAAAAFNGDLRVGIMWMSKPGTYDEWKDGASVDDITWNAFGKVIMIVLFSSTGFFGSSCSAAITKNFGALTMSMTSTARRATTLFISFFMFDNECTYEHITGVVVFTAAMATKSLMSRSKAEKVKLPLSPPPPPPPRSNKDLELGKVTTRLISTRSADAEMPKS